ncbi:hypothetical protein HMPREF1545_00578 [Oscillibacter sp. KLE 1728]|nr:hypothetical protein HMPREF1545_00578 [Oscillibacter sp. KLE 1728]
MQLPAGERPDSRAPCREFFQPKGGGREKRTQISNGYENAHTHTRARREYIWLKRFDESQKLTICFV